MIDTHFGIRAIRVLSYSAFKTTKKARPILRLRYVRYVLPLVHFMKQEKSSGSDYGLGGYPFRFLLPLFREI